MIEQIKAAAAKRKKKVGKKMGERESGGEKRKEKNFVDTRLREDQFKQKRCLSNHLSL